VTEMDAERPTRGILDTSIAIESFRVNYSLVSVRAMIALVLAIATNGARPGLGAMQSA